ncbi:hypothetical protein D3C81_1906060 [compost metagenome]
MQAEGGDIGVDTCGKIIGQHFGDVVAYFLRVPAVIRQALQVCDQHKLLIVVLQRNTLAQRSDIVAKMQRASRTVASENSRFRVHERLLKVLKAERRL